jgi:NADPH:quinone reductase
MTEAKTVVLKVNLDEGVPGPEHFTIESKPAPSVPADGILVQALVFSADPYLVSLLCCIAQLYVKHGDVRSLIMFLHHVVRYRLSGSSQRNGLKTGQRKPGTAMDGFIAGKVLESNHAAWKAGDLFGASRPFTTVQAISADELKSTLIWKLTDHITEDQIGLGIGVLGMPGATVYGGVVDVLRPKEGETLFVSAASGAVGSVVGQLAKNVYKCKVIGSCGGPTKCDFIKKQFGFDHAIDYKQAKNKDDLVAALKEAAPDGIDMYFEVSANLACIYIVTLTACCCSVQLWKCCVVSALCQQCVDSVSALTCRWKRALPYLPVAACAVTAV